MHFIEGNTPTAMYITPTFIHQSLPPHTSLCPRRLSQLRTRQGQDHEDYLRQHAMHGILAKTETARGGRDFNQHPNR